jgi:hypothetical protein
VSHLLTAKVLPRSAERWVAVVGGGGVLAATTIVTVLALPHLPAATALLVGIGLGVAGVTLAGGVIQAFRRPPDVTFIAVGRAERNSET